MDCQAPGCRRTEVHGQHQQVQHQVEHADMLCWDAGDMDIGGVQGVQLVNAAIQGV